MNRPTGKRNVKASILGRAFTVAYRADPALPITTRHTEREPMKPAPPFIPGHEGIGVVEQVGPGAAVRRIGDRVAIAWLGSACGRCAYCISGRETLCEAQRNSGYSVDGAYAEFAVADERFRGRRDG